MNESLIYIYFYKINLLLFIKHLLIERNYEWIRTFNNFTNINNSG